MRQRPAPRSRRAQTSQQPNKGRFLSTILFISGLLSATHLVIGVTKEAAPVEGRGPTDLAIIARQLPVALPKAPPLKIKGKTISVSDTEGLFRAVEEAPSGAVIALADGTYWLPRRLTIRTDGLSLIGNPTNPFAVVLDGSRYDLGEIVSVTGATDVTIAHLTIQNARFNGLKLDTDTSVHRVRVYHCVFRNIWQRAIKGVRVPPDVEKPEGSIVQFCFFFNDRPKDFSDDPSDTKDTFGGNYIGGIDVMYAQRWLLSENVFYRIQGKTREGRGAIFLWHESEDCVVENNIIVDCDVGVALGNSYKPDDVKTHCRRVVVSNNFIVRCPESGIVADYTEDCLIAHNTIHDPTNQLKRLIRIVHRNPGLQVLNNLLSGPEPRIESPDPVLLQGNFVGPDLTDFFVDPEKGDLRLKTYHPQIVDRGLCLQKVRNDRDGRGRGVKPDIGAHEFQP